jgi:hypothetical protein
MRSRTISETLFEDLCSSCGVPCEAIPTQSVRTPDFVVRLGGVRVVCEIKQIDPNADDLAELRAVRSGETTGRYVPNRLRSKLKDVSAQLKAACASGCPTLLVVYDNTPFKMYSAHRDVVKAMFGTHSVTVMTPKQPGAEPIVSKPFFGRNRGVTPNQNTAVSAVAILDGGPASERSLRAYHNPYASVVLAPELLEFLRVTQCVLPGDTTVRV